MLMAVSVAAPAVMPPISMAVSVPVELDELPVMEIAFCVPPVVIDPMVSATPLAAAVPDVWVMFGLVKIGRAHV